MHKIVTRSDWTLRWRHPNMFKMEYELCDGDEPVATLRFRSSWDTLATTQSADGCWTFKQVGFFRRQAIVRTCDGKTDLAILKNNAWAGGGTLILSDGRRYLVTSNFWQTEYNFKTPEGELLASCKSNIGFLRQSTQIAITPAGANLLELPMMVLLGWYLTVLMSNDSAAFAVIAAVG